MCEDYGDKIQNLENENKRLLKINENQADKILLLKGNLTHLQQEYVSVLNHAINKIEDVIDKETKMEEDRSVSNDPFHINVNQVDIKDTLVTDDDSDQKKVDENVESKSQKVEFDLKGTIECMTANLFIVNSISDGSGCERPSVKLSSSAPSPAPFQSGQCQNSKNSFEVNVSNLRLKLKRKRSRADAIISVHHHHHPPPETF